jgi:hypothetical protein
MDSSMTPNKLRALIGGVTLIIVSLIYMNAGTSLWITVGVLLFGAVVLGWGLFARDES